MLIDKETTKELILREFEYIEQEKLCRLLDYMNGYVVLDGHWLTDGATCSRCGAHMSFDDNWPKFCPNCCAQIIGVKGDVRLYE